MWQYVSQVMQVTDQFNLFQGWQDLEMEGANVRFCEDWLDQARQDLYWRAFQSLAWQQQLVRIAGRQIKIPRLNAWYGDSGADYGYSGIKLPRTDWTAELLELKRSVEAACGHQFNAVLANYYRGGRDSVDWHADDERELGSNPVIASVSLGAERLFRFKHRHDRSKSTRSILLTSGSLLEMSGCTQSNWLHQIPKTKKEVNGRINLTFRRIFS